MSEPAGHRPDDAAPDRPSPPGPPGEVPSARDGTGHRDGIAAEDSLPIEDLDTQLDDPAPVDRRRLRRTVPLTIGSVLLAGALLVWVLPALTGVPWSRILHTLADAPPSALALLAGLAVLILAAQSVTLMAAVPGMRASTAVPTTAITSALTVSVPSGSVIGLAVTWHRLRRSGARRGAVLTGIVVVSAADLAVSLLLPVTGAVALAAAGADPGAGILTTVWVLTGLSLVVAVVAVLLLRRGPFARLVAAAFDTVRAFGAAAEGLRWTPAVVLGVRDAALDLLRRRAPALLLGPVAMRVLQALALLVALDAVGLEVPVAELVAVFVLGRMLAAVPLTPGGIGIAETGSAAALIALGHDPDAAVAASLLVTVTTLVGPIVLGLLGGLVAGIGGPRAAGTSVPTPSAPTD